MDRRFGAGLGERIQAGAGTAAEDHRSDRLRVGDGSGCLVIRGVWFRVKALGFRVKSLGFRLQSIGFRV